MNRKYRPLIRVLGGVVALVSLGTIAYQLWQTWPHLQGVHLQFGPGLLAFGAIGLSFVLSAMLWLVVLRQLGTRVAWFTGVHIWFVSQVVRYAPGNVWHLLGRVYLGQRVGVSAQPLSLSMVLELMQVITGALLVGAVSLVFWPQHNVFGFWTLLLLPALVFYLWPSLLQRPLAWAIRRTGRQPTFVDLHRRDLLVLLPAFSVVWLLQGGGIYLLAVAVYPVPLSLAPAVIGSFAIAWVVGFLSFITPSGLGVREGVLSYLFSFLMPVPMALLLSLLARVWVTLAELGCVAVVVGVERWRNRQTTQKLTSF